MTTRTARLVACLVPLLVLGSGVALASSGPAIVAEGIRPHSMACLSDSCIAHRGVNYTSFHNQIALHCQCGGYDANGHCNHQVCN